MNSKHSMGIGVVLSVSAIASLGQSAWVPLAHEFKVTPGFSFSTFDEFWMKDTKIDNPPNGKSLNQYTPYLSLEYGILPNLAADATVGYSITDTDAFGGDSDDGLADSNIGLRYRIIDENNARYHWLPTLTVRIGGIIAGTYDENLPFSAGDGANGFEGSLLFGKAIGHSGFGCYGDIGYRVRENPVPDDLFGTVGIYQQCGPVTLTFGYRHVQGLSGLNIGGAGFDPSAGDSHGFPALREINQIVEGGVTYTDHGGRSYQFTVGGNVDGKNTGEKLILGFNATFPFGGH
jgi:hypothetical protein